MNFDQNNYLKTNEKMNTKKGHKKKNLIIVWTYSYWFEVIVTSKWLFIECSWDLWLMLCCVVRWPFRKIELMASPAGSPSRGQPSLVRPHLKSHLLPGWPLPDDWSTQRYKAQSFLCNSNSSEKSSTFIVPQVRLRFPQACITDFFLCLALLLFPSLFPSSWSQEHSLINFFSVSVTTSWGAWPVSNN